MPAVYLELTLPVGKQGNGPLVNARDVDNDFHWCLLLLGRAAARRRWFAQRVANGSSSISSPGRRISPALTKLGSQICIYLARDRRGGALHHASANAPRAVCSRSYGLTRPVRVLR